MKCRNDAQGLCMFCDELYSLGHHHKHQRAQIYIMEGDDDDPPPTEDLLHDPLEEDLNNDTYDPSIISVNALNGSTTFNCMQITGLAGKRKLCILIDPGSTHNFIDLAFAKAIGCHLDPVPPMSVAAANRKHMLSTFKCPTFQWTMQGYDYITEVRTLPLNYCDLVLGVQWLTTLGLIRWDFSNLRMEFSLNGTKLVFRVCTKAISKIIKSTTLNKIMTHGPQIALL